jgi:hypothetical protein
MTSRYAARLSPLGPETAWSIDGAAIVQQCGKSYRVHALATLDELTLNPAMPGRAHPSVTLRFGSRRMTIPSASYGVGGVRATPQEFSHFVRALAPIAQRASVSARFLVAGGKDYRGQLVWMVALLAAGAVGLALTAISSVTRGLGLSLAAWLAFAALLAAAVLPWITRAEGRFDPEAIPDGLLPATE